MFKIKNNRSNTVTAYGNKYKIFLTKFKTGIRVDIQENNNPLLVSENTNNNSFKGLVDPDCSLEEQVSQWAEKMISYNAVCDFCERKTIILPLKDYDLKNFPYLKNKKICPSCRAQKYNELIEKEQEKMQEEVDQINNEMIQEGLNHHYLFVVHPKSGDDFFIDYYSSEKLREKDIKQIQKEMSIKYNAALVEEPAYTLLKNTFN